MADIKEQIEIKDEDLEEVAGGVPFGFRYSNNQNLKNAYFANGAKSNQNFNLRDNQYFGYKDNQYLKAKDNQYFGLKDNQYFGVRDNQNFEFENFENQNFGQETK